MAPIVSPAVGTVKGAVSASTNSLQTPTQLVVDGASMFVHVAFIHSSSGTTLTVTDTEGGSYNLVQSGSLTLASGLLIYLYLYQRTNPLSPSSSFQVTVSFLSFVPAEVVAVEVLRSAGVDVAGAVHSGTSSSSPTTESAAVTTSNPNDLVLFFVAQNVSGTITPGFGTFPVAGYPTSGSGLIVSGWYSYQPTPGTSTPSLSKAAAAYWVGFSISISPREVAWQDIASRPFFVVSPIGLASGASQANNGADFGPDTPLTQTSGIQEAIDASHGWSDQNGKPTSLPVVLDRGLYVVNQTIHLRTLVPVFGWGAYFRNDVSHDTGTLVIPASGSGAFTGSCLWDSGYDGVTQNILIKSLYMSGVNCEANGQSIDGIHLDNPDHATLDHISMKNFQTAFLVEALNITDNMYDPGEVELISCLAASPTAYGFAFTGTVGSNSGGGTNPFVVTNVYLRTCHVDGGGQEAYFFLNTANVSGFDLWANGFTVAGIHCEAKNLNAQGSIFPVSSLKFYGVHLLYGGGTDLVESNSGRANIDNINGMYVNGGEATTYSTSLGATATSQVRLIVVNVGSTTSGFPGINFRGYSITTPGPPGGIGSGNRVYNYYPFPVLVSQQGGMGLVVVDPGAGTPVPTTLGAVSAPSFELQPGAGVYFTGAVPTGWSWSGR